MADKFDRIVEILVGHAPSDEKDETREIAIIVADALRTVEQVSSDIDRIATALEKIAEK